VELARIGPHGDETSLKYYHEDFSLKVRHRCHTEKCYLSCIICQELKMVTDVCIFS
jgi:hypothetical protein